MIVISSGCLNLVATEAKNVSHLSIGSWELPSWAHAEWRLSEILGLFGPEARMGITSPGVTSPGPSSEATHAQFKTRPAAYVTEAEGM